MLAHLIMSLNIVTPGDNEMRLNYSDIIRRLAIHPGSGKGVGAEWHSPMTKFTTQSRFTKGKKEEGRGKGSDPVVMSPLLRRLADVRHASSGVGSAVPCGPFLGPPKPSWD